MRQARTHHLNVLTPEGVEFSFQLAGPLARFFAWIIDSAVIVAMLVVLGKLLAVLGVISADFARALNLLAYFVVWTGYGIFMEWYFGGQTFGKRLMRLRVLDAQGLQLHGSQIVVRNLMRFVDSLPLCYLVGGLAALISRRAQRLGDLAAGTIVVAIPPAVEPDLDQLLQGKYNSFSGHPHLAARLRQRTSAKLAHLALTALMRREALDPRARIRLFSDIAEAFRALVAFPADSTEGISDEQYVRNCVDVLYRPASAGKPGPR